MDKKVIYIAGPMRNCYKFNFENFRKIAKRLRLENYEVVSPVEMDEAEGYSENMNLTHEQAAELSKVFAKRDLNALFKCTHIYMLPDWEKSIGATAERAVALWLGLTIIDEKDEYLYPRWIA